MSGKADMECIHSEDTISFLAFKQTLLGIRHTFLLNERLLKRARIYVDQSQGTSRFWKCSLDP